MNFVAAAQGIKLEASQLLLLAHFCRELVGMNMGKERQDVCEQSCRLVTALALHGNSDALPALSQCSNFVSQPFLPSKGLLRHSLGHRQAAADLSMAPYTLRLTRLPPPGVDLWICGNHRLLQH